MNRRLFAGVARDAGILTAQRLVQRVAGLVSLYFVVRHFTQVDFGVYQLVGVAIAVVAFMALPGLDNALMQSVSRGSRSFYRRAVSSSALFSVLGALLLTFAALIIDQLEPGAFGPLIVAAAVFPAYLGVGQWKSLFLAERRFLVLAGVEIFTSVVTHGGLIAATLLEVQQVWVFALIYLAPAAATNVVLTSYFWFKTRPTEATEESRALYRFGLQTSAVTIVSMIAEQIERLSLFVLIDPTAMAVYLAGDRISELIRAAFQDLAAVLAPRFSKMSVYDQSTAQTIQRICLVAGIAIVVFAFTLAPPLLSLIFGKEYHVSIPYAQALLCSVAIGNVGQFQFRFIRSQRDSRSFRAITLWTSASRIVGAVGLTALFGIWGAVASVFLHRIAMSALTSAIIRREYGGNSVRQADDE